MVDPGCKAVYAAAADIALRGTRRSNVASLVRLRTPAATTTTPSEVPAVYEKKDDKPALINFTFRDGLYILDHVVTDGYLSIGAKRLPFFERP